MATAPKRKFISKNDQEQLLQDLYKNMGDDEDAFLGHHFVDSDVDDESNFTDDESDAVPEQGPIEDDGEEKDNDDGEDQEIDGYDNDNAQIEPVVDNADDANIDNPMPAEIPKKQKFKILTKFSIRIITLIYRPKENVRSSTETPKIL